MEGHGGAGLEVSELEEASCHVGVVIEEAEEPVLELGELLLAGQAGVVLQVVVQQVDGFRLEEGAQLRVVVDDVAQVHLVDLGVQGSVTHSRPEQHPGQNGQALEAEGEVPELVEEEGNGGEDGDLEGVLEAAAAVVDGLEGGEDAVEGVLHDVVERRAHCGGILGLVDLSGLESVLQVGVIGRSPLVLPPHVVGIAGGPADLVKSEGVKEALR